MPLSFMDTTKALYNPKSVERKVNYDERAQAQFDAASDVASPIAEVTSDITHALGVLDDQIDKLYKRVSCVSMSRPPEERKIPVSPPARGGSPVFVCLNETLDRVRVMQNKITTILNGLEI